MTGSGCSDSMRPFEACDNASGWVLAPVVDALCEANAELLRDRRRKLGRNALPSREALAEIVTGPGNRLILA